jgi:hypothetical protein
MGRHCFTMVLRHPNRAVFRLYLHKLPSPQTTQKICRIWEYWRGRRENSGREPVSNHYLATHYPQGSRKTYLQYFCTEQFKPFHCTARGNGKIRAEFVWKLTNSYSGRPSTCNREIPVFESRSSLQLSWDLSRLCSVLRKYVLYKLF